MVGSDETGEKQNSIPLVLGPLSFMLLADIQFAHSVTIAGSLDQEVFFVKVSRNVASLTYFSKFGISFLKIVYHHKKQQGTPSPLS